MKLWSCLSHLPILWEPGIFIWSSHRPSHVMWLCVLFLHMAFQHLNESFILFFAFKPFFMWFGVGQYIHQGGDWDTKLRSILVSSTCKERLTKRVERFENSFLVVKGELRLGPKRSVHSEEPWLIQIAHMEEKEYMGDEGWSESSPGLDQVKGGFTGTWWITRSRTWRLDTDQHRRVMHI